MTRWTVWVALTAALMLIAPTTAATAENNETATEESENAWVEDCPPEMMCAFDDGREPYTEGNGTAEADPIRGDAQGNSVPGIGVLTVLALSAVMAVVGALAGPEGKQRRRR